MVKTVERFDMSQIVTELEKRCVLDDGSLLGREYPRIMPDGTDDFCTVLYNRLKEVIPGVTTFGDRMCRFEVFELCMTLDEREGFNGISYVNDALAIIEEWTQGFFLEVELYNE